MGRNIWQKLVIGGLIFISIKVQAGATLNVDSKTATVSFDKSQDHDSGKFIWTRLEAKENSVETCPISNFIKKDGDPKSCYEKRGWWGVTCWRLQISATLSSNSNHVNNDKYECRVSIDIPTGKVHPTPIAEWSGEPFAPVSFRVFSTAGTVYFEKDWSKDTGQMLWSGLNTIEELRECPVFLENPYHPNIKNDSCAVKKGDDIVCWRFHQSDKGAGELSYQVSYQCRLSFDMYKGYVFSMATSIVPIEDIID